MGQTHTPVGCSTVSARPAGAGRLPGAAQQSSGAGHSHEAPGSARPRGQPALLRFAARHLAGLFIALLSLC